MMAENNRSSHAVGLPLTESDDSGLIPDPDEAYPDLNVAESNDPTVFSKPGKKGKSGESSNSEEVPQYILGTLVVRVVAARDLEPVQKTGLGQMVFGASRSGGNHRGSQGTANPYASVKFGESTQRSSEVYGTLDPIWPRQEAMFMDVALPLSEVAHSNSNEASSLTDQTPHSTSNTDEAQGYLKPPTVMTVALFHTPEVGNTEKYPSKGLKAGDSDDMFLGMASIDLQCLFTGKDHTFDGWLRLSGTETSRGSVRIVCEYEASDPAPRPGDSCRFTRYCNPRDLFPLVCGKQYQIAEVDGDNVIISYTTAEGWVCSFQAHRFMLICEERHQSSVEVAQDELALIAERLSHSPLVHSITESVERVAVDGLLNVGEDAVRGGISLINRWFSSGVDTVIGDVANVINWDGRHNPDVAEDLVLPSVNSNTTEIEDLDSKPAASTQAPSYEKSAEAEALPNMPCCPITGEPMIDPVVAADGESPLLSILLP